MRDNDRVIRELSALEKINPAWKLCTHPDAVDQKKTIRTKYEQGSHRCLSAVLCSKWRRMCTLHTQYRKVRKRVLHSFFAEPDPLRVCTNLLTAKRCKTPFGCHSASCSSCMKRNGRHTRDDQKSTTSPTPNLCGVRQVIHEVLGTKCSQTAQSPLSLQFL